MLGLLRIAVTFTYLPPIWLMTLAYWFSAPTAATTPLLRAGSPEQAHPSMATATQSAATFARSPGCKS